MNDNNLVRNIKMLVVFFSLCFLSIIFYLTYFNLYVADKIVSDPTNKRMVYAENEVLRGSILERNGKVLAESKRAEDGSQIRTYKSGELYAHATGYSSINFSKTGVELAYNDVLQGKAASLNMIGTVFKTIRENINRDEKRGNDVILTLDGKLQDTAYKMLGNDRGAVVAMDPRTGEILAMVSKPSFNPQIFADNNNEKVKELRADGLSRELNRATQGTYPPGSTFKIITAVSALENLPGIDKETFDCTGGLKIGNYTLKDYGGERHGKIDLLKAFEESCNFTFGSLGMKLGFNNLEKTGEKFRFNSDIPSSDAFNVLKVKSGGIKSEDERSKALTAQDAIGQHGVTANPLHMALVASTIANDGVMMKPYMVKEIRDRYGVSINETKPEKLADVIDKNTARTIRGYMEKVVKSGTGTNAKIPGITVAGKTGTAEVDGGGESHSWFVSFADTDKGPIAVAVIVENGGVGGKRAAEISREVMKAYIR